MPLCCPFFHFLQFFLLLPCIGSCNPIVDTIIASFAEIWHISNLFLDVSWLHCNYNLSQKVEVRLLFACELHFQPLAIYTGHREKPTIKWPIPLFVAVMNPIAYCHAIQQIYTSHEFVVFQDDCCLRQVYHFFSVRQKREQDLLETHVKITIINTLSKYLCTVMSYSKFPLKPQVFPLYTAWLHVFQSKG